LRHLVKDAEMFTPKVLGCCLELSMEGDSYENPRENLIEKICFPSPIGRCFLSHFFETSCHHVSYSTGNPFEHH